MLRGELVVLRPVERDDLERLWRWYFDTDTWQKVKGEPVSPVPFEAYVAKWERTLAEPGDDARFAVEAGGDLIGRCDMFGFDHLARNAQIGITIGDPSARGRGFGKDIVRTLLAYGFRYRNLERIGLTVLETNVAAIKAYRATGFVEEGRRRRFAYVDGEYVDELLFSVLREEWETS